MEQVARELRDVEAQQPRTFTFQGYTFQGYTSQGYTFTAPHVLDSTPITDE